jgi:hypothetical protein
VGRERALRRPEVARGPVGMRGPDGMGLATLAGGSDARGDGDRARLLDSALQFVRYEL